MSIITANPSMISVDNRSRISSKHMRHYKKVSEVNLDEKAIISYLRSHSLHKTLATFVNQSHYSKSIEPIVKIIEGGAKRFQGNFEEFISTVKAQCQGKQNEKHNKKWLVLQCYLYIWFCLHDNVLEKSKLSTLKSYLSTKGDILSQLPQLLPYFALPYAENPTSHPFLRCIFTSQWKADLLNLLLELSGKKPQDRMQEQWLNIIQDLIEISSQLYRNLNGKNGNVQSMMERVNLYKYVIEKNKEDSMKSNQKVKEQISSEVKQLNFNDIAEIKEKIERLQADLMHSRRLGSSIELSVIYHKIYDQLQTHTKFKQDLKYIHSLANTDILCFKTRESRTIEFQQLKLFNALSSYSQGRSYIALYPHLISVLKIVIQNHFKEPSMPAINLKTLQISFDLLRKMVGKQQVLERLLKQKGFIDFLLRIFGTLKMCYMKGGKSAYASVLTSCTNLLTQIVLHRKGRQTLTKTLYFDLLIQFLHDLNAYSRDQALEKQLCSSLYLLLIEPINREKAEHFKLKDLFLDQMLQRKDPSYEVIVKYIVERIQIEGDIEEGQSQDEDEKEDENEGIDINRNKEDTGIIWHRGEKINIQEIYSRGRKDEQKENSQMLKNKKIGEQKAMRRKSSSQKNRSVQKKLYSPDKYNWKGSKAKLFQQFNK